MKTTVDIPEAVLSEAMHHTKAKTKREAVVSAIQRFNRLQRLRELNSELKGTFANFMTQEELAAMREDSKWGRSP